MKTWKRMRLAAGMLGFAMVLGCGGETASIPDADYESARASNYASGDMADSVMMPQAMPPGELLEMDEGQGPGMGGDKYDLIVENQFQDVRTSPLSTFSIDVDTASYAKVRSYLLGQQRMPRPDAVRIEEFVNYFDYDYNAPEADSPHPFIANVGLTDCPWEPNHKLARVAIKGMQSDRLESGPSNLVFLIDVSGSMKGQDRLPLLKQAIGMLATELGPNDRVSMVVYAGASGVVLDGAEGSDSERIMRALRELEAGGSTNGGEGIELAYQLAREHFVEGGVNRVILCSDGDFNVGATGTDQLVRMVESNAKDNVFLTVLGFGMGNHNDAMMEQISGRGNGNYFFIDTVLEARKVLVHDLKATLVTIAKDVKIQIEFNPQKVAAYRLIGYENRMLESQDFNNDKKDAGEIGAGHCVTALYEVVPTGTELPESMASVDPLRYQESVSTEGTDALSDEWLLIRLRYKQPEEEVSRLVEFVVKDAGTPFEAADRDMRFAAAVAGFGMLLRDSDFKGAASYDDVLQIAEGAVGEDPFGIRREFCEMVRVASRLN